MLHQVGAGTLGPVFRAHDPAEGRLVAVKAFRLDLIPERAAEFAAALNALGGRRLDHPAIAAPIAAGVEGTTPWLAQAYVPAESLDTALRQYGPPPLGDALAIMTALAGALDFAAAAGVLHGALHPRDVLVAPDDTRLVDLGVAAALEGVGLRAPMRRPYTAPEREAGEPASRAADVFSLGAIGFELITGLRVGGAGDEAVAALPEIPGANREALVDAFAFALSAAPDERFTTALGFVAALRRALGDVPLLAAPRPRPAPGPVVDRPAPVATEPPPVEVAPPQPSLIAGPALAVEQETRPTSSSQSAAVPEPRAAAPSKGKARGHRARGLPGGTERASQAAPPRTDGTPDQDDAPIADRVVLGNMEFRPAQAPAEPDWESHEAAALQGADPAAPVVPPLSPALPRASFSVVSLPLVATVFVAGALVGLGLGWILFGQATVRPARAGPAAAPAAVAKAPAPATPRMSAVSKADEGVPAQVAGPSAPSPKQAATAGQAAPAPVRGQLVVRSNPPGARVEVNGRSRGRTPLTLRDLPLGALTLRVTRDGFTPQQRRVTLTASRASQAIDVPLAKTAAAKPAAPAKPAAGFVGSVFVETRPAGARVFLDGREVGTSPVDVPGVAAGSHVVRIELQGRKRWSASVTVVAGERNRVAASLEEEEVR